MKPVRIQSKAKIVGLMALVSLSAASCAADDMPEEGSGGLGATSGSGGTSSGTTGIGGKAGGGVPNGGASGGGNGGAGGSGAESGGMAQGGGTSGAAGTAASGGTSSGGGSSGKGGTGGSGGACQKGTVAANEVLVIGDSFIAINHAITNEVERLAREAGALNQNEDYQDRSASGTTLANNQIPGQYAAAANQGPIKVVLMNGGGNDCLQNNGDAAVSAATTLFETMGDEGTDAVVYFFYPDPQGSLGAGSLKGCLDTARPKMKMLCESLTAPKCYFIDLRPVFEGKYSEYVSSDGIHPTTAGGNAAGKAIWKTMQDNCIAQ